MSIYELLWQCYLSGQVSEEQWQEHLRDEVFKAWVDKRRGDWDVVGPPAGGDGLQCCDGDGTRHGSPEPISDPR